MTTFAHELTLNDRLGLVVKQFVFDTTNSRFFDGVTGRFIDQAAYSEGEPERDCYLYAGSPLATTLAGNGVQGIKLDRTNKYYIPTPIAFEGGIIAEFEHHTPSATSEHYPLLGATGANANNFFHWKITVASGNRTVAISNASYSVNNFGANTIAQADPTIVMAGFDQANNVAYRSLNGSTITTTASSAVTTSGWPNSTAGDRLLRLGDINNDGSIIAMPDFTKIARLSFIKGRPTSAGDIARLTDFFTTRQAILG